jgi:hypothetical protein
LLGNDRGRCGRRGFKGNLQVADGGSVGIGANVDRVINNSGVISRKITRVNRNRLEVIDLPDKRRAEDKRPQAIFMVVKRIQNPRYELNRRIATFRRMQPLR